jgi:hypothetical protein
MSEFVFVSVAARRAATWHIFALSTRAGRAPGLKVGLGPLRQEHGPRVLESGPCLMDGVDHAPMCVPGARCPDRSRNSSPRWLTGWNADARGDQADLDVVIKEVPALVSIGIAAASDYGHGPKKRVKLVPATDVWPALAFGKEQCRTSSSPRSRKAVRIGWAVRCFCHDGGAADLL